MIPSSSGVDWPSSEQGTHGDTIDLTLSSPEPEHHRRKPPQQQRLPSCLKKEPRSDIANQARVKSKSGFQGSSSRGSQSQQIDPRHLAQVVNTSSSHAIKSVLWELCKISPALSEAVVRGLAPHSTYAQGLIRQQTLRASASGPVKREESNSHDSYERTKRRLAAQINARASNSNHVQSRSTISSADTPPTGSQSVPRTKRERHIDISDSDSDLDQYIPDEFPLSAQQAKTDRLPLRNTSTWNSANHTARPTPLAERFPHVQSGSGTKTANKICKQCHELVEDEVGLCFYHSGSQLNVNGGLVCSECIESWVEQGCSVGMHVIEEDVDMPSRSQSPSKRPRIV